MQDRQTGEMLPISRDRFEQLTATPEEARDSAAFQQGEEIVIRSAWFVVERITNEGIFLRGIPTPKRMLSRYERRAMKRHRP